MISKTIMVALPPLSNEKACKYIVYHEVSKEKQLIG